MDSLLKQDFWSVGFKVEGVTELPVKFVVEGGAHCTMECHMAGVMRLERKSSASAQEYSSDGDEATSEDSSDGVLSQKLARDELKSLLADSQRSKLVNKLSEANQQNRFLKRQLSVQVMGSFDGWSEGKQLSPEYTGSFSKFSATLMLRPGRYEIKFLVDGEWHLTPELPIVGEGMMINNLLIVE